MAGIAQEQRDRLMDSLPSLPIGTAWVWSPGWLNTFLAVTIRQRTTFDSSATPTLKSQALPPDALASVDLSKLRVALDNRGESTPQSDKAGARKANAASLQQINLEQDVSNLSADELKALIESLLTITKNLNAALLAVKEKSANDQPKPTKTATPKEQTVKSGSKKLTAPQQNILNALADFAAFGLVIVSRQNVAVFAKQSPTSSGFTNNLGRLRSLGLIDYPSGGVGSDIRPRLNTEMQAQLVIIAVTGNLVAASA
ncbi:hypothetical protein LC593_35900 [Nostoc sp. CHAB 5844]|nr:hypothetical protein [Nostoc sp. CHAB 5844]